MTKNKYQIYIDKFQRLKKEIDIIPTVRSVILNEYIVVDMEYYNYKYYCICLNIKTNDICRIWEKKLLSDKSKIMKSLFFSLEFLKGSKAKDVIEEMKPVTLPLREVAAGVVGGEWYQVEERVERSWTPSNALIPRVLAASVREGERQAYYEMMTGVNRPRGVCPEGNVREDDIAIEDD